MLLNCSESAVTPYSNNETIFLYEFVDHDPVLKFQQASTGVTYERWGRTTCGGNAERVYEGYMANGYTDHTGTGSKYICLPETPTYVQTEEVQFPGLLYSTEYQTGDKVFSSPTHDYDAPCAVCYVPRSAMIMIPAQVACPNPWNLEYNGYLMSNYIDHPNAYDHVCVDEYPETIPGSNENRNGALLYFDATDCGVSFIPCLPYKNRVPLSCVVCTR